VPLSASVSSASLAGPWLLRKPDGEEVGRRIELKKCCSTQKGELFFGRIIQILFLLKNLNFLKQNKIIKK
jgi:hypothetical protein